MLRIYVKNPPSPVEIVPDYYPVKYGLLYNWYAATDERKITSSDTWVVPTKSNFETLITHVGGLTEGGKLKQTEFIYWNSPNTGATNEMGFNARGSGIRGMNGVFANIKGFCYIWTTTRKLKNYYNILYLTYGSSSMTIGGDSHVKSGLSVRTFRTATVAEQLLADGTACAPYIGNDGKIYRTVKIGTQVWLACNLAETKFRNGDWIPGYDGGVYTPIDNATWAAATTAMCCVYDDDLTNM